MNREGVVRTTTRIGLLAFGSTAIADGHPKFPNSVYGTVHMVSAANPLASQAGLDILEAGGTAMDAAVAVQLVLNLVEPCLLYTSPSPRDRQKSRMPSSA